MASNNQARMNRSEFGARRGSAPALVLAAAASVAAAQESKPNPSLAPAWRYSITEITSPVDVAPYSARAWGISNNTIAPSLGEPRVVGEFGLGSHTPDRPFAWTRLTQAIDAAPGIPGVGVARDVNNQSVAAGTMILPLAGPLPANRAFVAGGVAGTGIVLPGVAGQSSTGMALNDARTVVGSSMTTTGQVMATAWFPNASGGFVAVGLGTLGGSTSEATSISQAGQVVGHSLNGAGIDRAFVLWPNIPSPLAVVPIMIDLGSLVNSGWSVARDVNENLRVVGQSKFVGLSTSAAATQSRAVMWYLGPLTPTPTGIVNLGVAANHHTHSDALGVNNRHEAVGWSGTSISSSVLANQVAVVHKNGRMHDLNRLIPANSAWRLLVASDINDAGQIVGWGYRITPLPVVPEVRAFLLTPAPSPAADLP